MAPHPGLPLGLTSSHRSILSIQKSEGPFTEQLNEAIAILGIDSHSDFRFPETFAVDDRDLDPRYEWTLRWLLKNLGSGVGQETPSSQNQAWILLQIALSKTPFMKSARLLIEGNFMKTVKQTLEWLQCSLRDKDSLSGCKHTRANPAALVSELENHRSGSKTLKAFSDQALSVAWPERASRELNWVFELFSSIFSGIRQVQLYINYQQHANDEIIAERMLQALKAPVDETASILGSLVYLLYEAIEYDGNSEQRGSAKWAATGVVETHLNSYIELWETRCLRVENHSKQHCYESFVRFCLIPALLLLHTLRKLLPVIGINVQIQRLELLVLTNVVLPARNSYNSLRSDDSKNDDAFYMFLEANLQEQTRSLADTKPPETEVDNYTRKVEMLLTLLFNISVRYTPRPTTKAKNFEAMWLQKIFVICQSCLEAALDPKASVCALQRYRRALQCLLKEAQTFNVKLDIGSIQLILDRTSGLLSGEEMSADISLINLCLLNNADVFTIPLDSNRNDKFSFRTPNQYLSALLKCISQYTWNEAIEIQDTYQFVVISLAIPLLEAFSEARDFTGFLGHIKEQLDWAQVKSVNGAAVSDSSTMRSHPTIWESDDVTIAIAGYVEENISAQQIESALIETEERLTARGSHGFAKSIGLGDLVVLDCVLSGCQSDEILYQLSKRAESIFEHLGTALDSLDLGFGRKWRIWRTLSMIYRKWNVYATGESWCQLTQHRARAALKIFTRVHADAIAVSPGEFQEWSSAFGYLLSFCTFGQELLPQDTDFSSRSMVAHSVQKLLEVEATIKQGYASDVAADFDIKKRQNTWNSGYFGICDMGSFVTSCLTQMLYTENTISCLDQETQNDLLKKLFQKAMTEADNENAQSAEHLASKSYTLWNVLLQSKDFARDQSLRRNARRLQVREYLYYLDTIEKNFYSSDDPLRHQFVLKSISGSPATEFSREQRTSIANKTLQCRKQLRAFDSITYLYVLENFCQHLNTSMDILRQPDPKSGLHLSNGLANSCFLFVLAWEMEHDQDPTNVVRKSEVLVRLTRNASRYICSSLHEESSVKSLLNICKPIEKIDDARGDAWTSESTMLLLMMTFLNCLHENRDNIPASVGDQAQAPEDLRHRHWKLVCAITDALHKDRHNVQDRFRVACLIQCLCGYSDITAHALGAADKVCSDIGAILDSLKAADGSNQGDPGLTDDGLSAMFDNLRCKLSLQQETPSALVPGIFDLITQVSAGKQTDHQTRVMCNELVAGLDQDHVKDFIRSPQFSSFSQSSDCSQLDLLRIMFSHAEGAIIGDIRLDLVGGLSNLLCTLQRPHEYQVHMIAMQCIDTILRRLPRIVGQHHIDAVLSSVITHGSKIASEPTIPHSEKIYIGLCRIVTGILIDHRLKIGGRYHLVVPALQSLLRCLYSPYASSDENAVSGQVENASAFGPTHAQMYARILSTLCDPSPSTVTRSRKRSRDELNDVTKRAKNTTGQYIQYLIMTYCVCQLTSRLNQEEMQKTLQPGIWAALECMSPETMRTMSAALDSDARAVWKRVYDEWREFGRWTGA